MSKQVTVEEIVIEGVTYVPKGTQSIPEGPLKIAVLQRGWVGVGRVSKNGEIYTLENASTVRYWGTTKGLGEIAMGGPTPKTILDRAGTITFHELTVVMFIQCEEASWARTL